jgi:hypothetical protein
MLHVVTAAQAAIIHHHARTRPSPDSGQTTAEYALVLLGAAAIALLLVAWATKTDRVGRLLNAVLDRIMSQLS